VTTETDSSPAIATSGVVRAFGNVRAVDGFDFEVPFGKVTALVGPNGAGKTTLLLILAGLLAPDEGRVSVAGFDPVEQPYEVHRAVGWMPDFFGVYEGLTSVEYLVLFGAAFHVPAPQREPRARELLAAVDLEKFADAPVHTMSRGQKQRLGFARAVVHRPRVLLLDEPASGLDPRARIALRELVREQANDGVGVLVSSHILTELEEMSDIVAFADAGRSRGVYPLGELPQEVGRRSTWRLRALDPDALTTALRTHDPAPAIDAAGTAVVELDGAEAAADLVERLVAAGVRLVEVAPEARGLEDAFMSMGGGSG